MGGAAGHLAHVWENRELTFNDIAQILSDAATGKLENVIEKFDGVQVSFSYTPRGLRFARNKSEMINGGLAKDELIAKFSDKPNVKHAFVTGYEVLSKAMAAAGYASRTACMINVGGSIVQAWYSAEIMCSRNSNVICYDKDAVVFHGFPTYVVVNGQVQTIDGTAGVAVLRSAINKMQAAVSMLSWRIHAPEIANIQKLSDGTFLSEALDVIHNTAMTGSCTMNDTLNTYVSNLMTRTLNATVFKGTFLGPNAVKMVVARCLDLPGCPSLTKIKGTIPKQLHDDVSAFVSSAPAFIKRSLEPLELAITKFTMELLKGVKSSFLADQSAEADRIRNAIDSAISDVQATGDPRMLDVLNAQLAKLDKVGPAHVGSEGVVFIYKNRAYKFTGCFGPVNQILGLLRYKR